ncbi:O-antigen ligase family protein [Candidatus Pelagibacter sp.]|nr:O-antigen ligase family protein [Candidatus Pelagibacter sp.]
MIKKNLNPNNSILFYNIPIILTILIPLLLVTGPFLSDLALSICAIIFLINVVKFKNYSYIKNIYSYIFLVFIALIIVSSFLSDDVIYSSKSSIFYIRFYLFTLSTWYLINLNTNMINYIFISLLICFIFLILDGFTQFFFGENIFGWPLIKTRVSSFFGDELILGSYLSRLFPILFAGMIYRNETYKKKDFIFYLVVLIFILSEVLVFLSGERIAFFYLNLSAIFILLLSVNYKKIRLFTLSFSLILIIAISNFAPQFKERMVDKTIEQIGIKSDQQYIFSPQHNDHYISALKIFKKNIVFGIGPKMFRHKCSEPEYIVSNYSCSTHPHNTYLQLLSETGIFSFLIIFFIFCFFIFKTAEHFFLKIFKKKIIFSDFQIALLSSILITLWPLAPTGNFFNNWISILYFYPIGIFLWTLKNQKKA